GLLITVLQALSAYMGVNLGCGQTLVAEQFLHATDVGPGVEQVRGKAMAERVRAGSRVQSSQGEIFFEQTADAANGESSAAVIEKHCRLPVRRRGKSATHGQPRLHGLQGWSAQER